MKIKTDRISGISAFITPKMREHAVPGMAAALISGVRSFTPKPQAAPIPIRA